MIDDEKRLADQKRVRESDVYRMGTGFTTRDILPVFNHRKTKEQVVYVLDSMWKAGQLTKRSEVRSNNKTTVYMPKNMAVLYRSWRDCSNEELQITHLATGDRIARWRPRRFTIDRRTI